MPPKVAPPRREMLTSDPMPFTGARARSDTDSVSPRRATPHKSPKTRPGGGGAAGRKGAQPTRRSQRLAGKNTTEPVVTVRQAPTTELLDGTARSSVPSEMGVEREPAIFRPFMPPLGVPHQKKGPVQIKRRHSKKSSCADVLKGCKARELDRLWSWKVRAIQRYRRQAGTLRQKLKKMDKDGKVKARKEYPKLESEMAEIENQTEVLKNEVFALIFGQEIERTKETLKADAVRMGEDLGVPGYQSGSRPAAKAVNAAKGIKRTAESSDTPMPPPKKGAAGRAATDARAEPETVQAVPLSRGRGRPTNQAVGGRAGRKLSSPSRTGPGGPAGMKVVPGRFARSRGGAQASTSPDGPNQRSPLEAVTAAPLPSALPEDDLSKALANKQGSLRMGSNLGALTLTSRVIDVKKGGKGTKMPVGTLPSSVPHPSQFPDSKGGKAPVGLVHPGSPWGAAPGSPGSPFLPPDAPPGARVPDDMLPPGTVLPQRLAVSDQPPARRPHTRSQGAAA